jgi:hypothetical protein
MMSFFAVLRSARDKLYSAPAISLTSSASDWRLSKDFSCGWVFNDPRFSSINRLISSFLLQVEQLL